MDFETTSSSNKRRRTTQSCLSCQKRKLKCDKTFPCSTCRTRGEGECCQYEAGSTPPPQQVMVTLEQHNQLRNDLNTRIDTLERLILDLGAKSSTKPVRHASTTYPSPVSLDDRNAASPATSQSRSRFQNQSYARSPTSVAQGEHALNQLDSLVGDGSYSGASSTPSSELAGRYSVSQLHHTILPKLTWPSILLSSPNPSRREQDTMGILAMVPRHDALDIMIESFFRSLWITPMQHPHESTFRQEIQQFHLERTNYLYIDPAWLAILTIALGIGISSLLEEDDLPLVITGIGYNAASLRELMHKLLEAYETAVICADASRPQLRVLYAGLLKMALTGRSIVVDDRVEFDMTAMRVVRFGTLTGIARALRIHLLGPGSSIHPPNDPMLPRENPLYAREICARLFHSLVMYDTFLNCVLHGKHHAGHIFFFPHGSYSTEEPGNYDDPDLLSGTETSHTLSDNKPFVFDILRGRVANHWRHILRTLDDPDTMNYKTVLAVDDALSADQQYLVDLKANHVLNEREEIMWYSTNSSCQQRTLRLHRPYLLRSFKDKQYIYSRSASLAAAHEIMSDHRLLIARSGFRSVAFYSLFLFIHHFSSMNILFANGILDSHSRASARAEIKISHDVFVETARRAGPAMFTAAVLKGQRIAEVLMEILDHPPADTSFEDTVRCVLSKLNVQPPISLYPNAAHDQPSTAISRPVEAVPVSHERLSVPTNVVDTVLPPLPPLESRAEFRSGGANVMDEPRPQWEGTTEMDELWNFFMTGEGEGEQPIPSDTAQWNTRDSWASVLRSW